MSRDGPLAPVDISTLPHPGFATDLQAQTMVLLSLAEGTSIITENVFENRFVVVDELNRLGAGIETSGHHAVIAGPRTLSGTVVEAPDLRGGAALVTAGLVADGRDGGAQRAPHRPRVRRPDGQAARARRGRLAAPARSHEPSLRRARLSSHARTRPCAARERAAAEEHGQLPGLQGRRGRARPRGGGRRAVARRRLATAPSRRRSARPRRGAGGSGRSSPRPPWPRRSCTGSTAARRSATPGPPSTSSTPRTRCRAGRCSGRRSSWSPPSPWSPPISPSAVTSPSSWSAWPSWWSCWPRRVWPSATPTASCPTSARPAAPRPRRRSATRSTKADEEVDRPIPNKPMNILLIGSDKSAVPGDPGRSDTQMLVRLDPRDQEHLDALAAARPAGRHPRRRPATR